jgi:DNA-binding IclR family transcriptional regulator
MIQVLERAFKILELLSPDKGRSLDNLTVATSINKGTLCNILRTLVEMGYVEKSGNGSYLISKKFYELSFPHFQHDMLLEATERCVENLAEETEESGVLSILNKDLEVEIMAQAQFKRSVMVNEEIYKALSLYHSVTGRVLLALESEKKLREIVEKYGYPHSDWDGISSWEELCNAINEIRKKGISIMKNTAMEIKAFAVPVADKEGRFKGALGLTAPLARLDEKKIRKALKDNQENFEKSLTEVFLK